MVFVEAPMHVLSKTLMVHALELRTEITYVQVRTHVYAAGVPFVISMFVRTIQNPLDYRPDGIDLTGLLACQSSKYCLCTLAMVFARFVSKNSMP